MAAFDESRRSNSTKSLAVCTAVFQLLHVNRSVLATSRRFIIAFGFIEPSACGSPLNILAASSVIGLPTPDFKGSDSLHFLIAQA